MTESPTEEVVGSGRNLDEKGVDSTAIVANAADDAAAALPGSSSDSASAINSPIQGDENELIEPVDAEQLEPVADANDDCDDDDNNTAREGPTLSASAGASHSGQTQQPSTVANSGVIAKAQIPCASSDDGSVQKTSDSATTTTTLVATVESAPADSAAVAGGTGTSANSSAGTPKKGRRRKAMGVATGRAGVAGSHSGTPRAGAATTPASAAVAAAATLVKTGPPWVMPTPTTEEELKAAIEEIRGHTNLPTPPIPIPPKFDSRTSIKARIKRLQQYISSFECVGVLFALLLPRCVVSAVVMYPGTRNTHFFLLYCVHAWVTVNGCCGVCFLFVKGTITQVLATFRCTKTRDS